MDEVGFRIYNESMPTLLNLLDKFKVKATFFFTGEISRLIPDLIRKVFLRGHEVGSHGLWHEVNKSFDVLDYKEQLADLLESKKILEDIINFPVISFRAPALRVNTFTSQALIKSGFLIDSSISPQRFDLFLSFGNKYKFKRLFSPRKTYFTKEHSLFQRGNSPLIEVPLTSFFYPYVGNLLRLHPKLSILIRNIFYYESILFKKPIVFYMHPHEFLNGNETLIETNRRVKNYVSFLLADKLRRKLKLKNLGEMAFSLLERELSFFSKNDYNFITIRSYCEKIGFLK